MKRNICTTIFLYLICACLSCISTYAAEQSDDSSSEEVSTFIEVSVMPDPFVEPQEIPSEIDELEYSDAASMPDISNTVDPSVYEPSAEYIPVEDIELSEFNHEMYVKDTQNLSATVYPTMATDQIVQYSSSNSSVATINRSGKLTAVGKGNCRIYVSCGNRSEYYELTVKVKTETINVKSKYVVMKPGSQYNIEAKVQPSEASQDLTYESKDASVAVVDKAGVITAKASGNSAIIVSNEDTSVLISVIVNTNANDTAIYDGEDTRGDSNTSTDYLTKKIRNSSEQNIIVEGIDSIPSSALKELYGTDRTLTVKLNEYDISICGQDIYNANNEIDTELQLSTSNDGMLIKLNSKNELPGRISISLKKTNKNYKFFYLLDEQSHKYKRLNSLKNNTFEISSTGEYFLSTDDINQFNIDIVWILTGSGIILLLILIYIFTRKKYWFW